MGGNETCPAVVNVSNILPLGFLGRTSFHKLNRKGETGSLWNNIQASYHRAVLYSRGMSVIVKRQSGVSLQLCLGCKSISCFTKQPKQLNLNV